MLSDEQLKVVFVCVVFVVIIVQGIIILYNKKKGVNIEDNKFQLKLGLGALAIITVVFWFAKDLTPFSKIKITVAGFVVGLGSFFMVDRLGRKARKTLGIETTWDKERKRKGGNKVNYKAKSKQ